jgi:hypothetical protein
MHWVFVGERSALLETPLGLLNALTRAARVT